MTITSWPLVGRARELAALGAAWADPASPGALVTGGAGVGKSRLVAEFLAGAEADGVTVVRAVASEATAGIPLGALAAVVPAGAWAVDRQEALVDLVIDGLVGRDQVVILSVDDVNLLDETSHAVIAAVLAQRVAFVVATQRSGLPGRDDDLGLPGPDVAVVALDDLPLDAVSELLERAIGGDVAGDASYQIWHATSGNPLLVRELTMAAEESGELASTDGVWRLQASATPPPRVRELVAVRLNRVQAAERDVLELLAVAGSLPAPLAERLVTKTTVDRCLDRGLAWWDVSEEPPELRLAHPMYGEVLLADLGVLGRRRLTARLLEGASALPSRSVDVLRLATWQLDAGGGRDPALLISAARRARRLSELDLAERLLGVALASGATDDALVLLGEVQFTAGDCAHAEDSYREAERLIRSRLAERAADPLLVGALAFVGIARGWNLAWGLGRVAQAQAVNREVCEQLAETDPAAADELQAEAACYLALSGAPEAAAAQAHAVPAGSARIEVRRNHALAVSLISLGRSSDAISAAEDGLVAASGLPVGFGRESFGFVFSAARTEALLQAARLDEAGATALGSYHLAVASAHLSGQALSSWARGRVELARGRVDGARRWFHESEVLERSLGTAHGRRRWAPAGLAMALALSGDAAGAHRVLDAIDEADRSSPVDVVFLLGEVGRARARAFAAAGDTAQALAVLARTAQECRGRDDHATELAVLHDRMLLTDERDKRSSAEAVLERVPLVDGALADARAAHARAVLARSASDIVVAAEAFAGFGCLRLAADTALAGARLLDGEAGDRVCAAMRSRAEQWLGQTGGPVAADTDWALRRLAPRQREVARLAAAGLSNAEIAEQLGRSPRTIENHLYRAYQELGVDDRRGLVEMLGGDGRVPEPG